MNQLSKKEEGFGRQLYSFGIYEGQFLDGNTIGWGRTIYYDGRYTIGKYYFNASKDAKSFDKNGN